MRGSSTAQPSACEACETPLPPGAEAVSGLCPQCLLESAIGFGVVQESSETGKGVLSPGEWLGPFRILERIGEGGFSYVFLAEQERPVRRKVAVKVLRPGMDTSQVIARFEAERQALALMEHPNIARVIDAGESDEGRPFFAMELVDGAPIADYCEEKRLSLDERLRLITQVCEAVAHAHRKGIIHRDLKPSNILVSDEEGKPTPKVIDFGIARATEQVLTDRTMVTRLNQAVGTPAYMSPEQAEMRGADIDTRADIYSLGAVLYELLAGSPVIDHETIENTAYDEVLRMIREEDPRKPSQRAASKAVPKDLDWITMKALEKEPARRYESVKALGEDVANYLAGRPVEAGPPGGIYRLRKWAKRHKAVAGATVVVALSLVAATVVSTAMFFRAKNKEEETRLAEEQGRNTFSRSQFFRGVELIESGRITTGVAHLCGAVRTNPDNWAAGYRLAMTLAYEDFTPLKRVPFDYGTKVWNVELSPQGDYLAASGQDGQVRVWSLRTGKLAYRLGAVWNTNWSPMAIDPSGIRLAGTADQGRVCIWSLRDGSSLTPEFDTDGLTTDLAWDVTGKYLATASWRGTVTLWDVEAGEPRWQLKEPKSVAALAFSADSKYLATGCEDGFARIRDVMTGEEVISKMRVGRGISNLEFTPNGRWLVIASFHGWFAQVWNAKTGASASPRLWHTEKIVDLDVRPDGERFLTAALDGTTKHWRVPTGQLELSVHHGVNPLCAEYGPTGDWFVTGNEDHSSNGVVIEIREGEYGYQRGAPFYHPRGASSVSMTPDGHTLATGSRGGLCRVWDIRSWALVPLIVSEKGWTMRVKFSDDSKRLVVWSAGQKPRYRSAKTGKRLILKREEADGDNGLGFVHRSGSTHFHWTPEGNVTKALPPKFAPTPVASFAVSPDGTKLLTGGRDGLVRVWNINSEKLLFEFDRVGGSPVFAVGWNDDGRRAVTGCNDGTVLVWNTESGKLLATEKGPASPIRCARISLAGHRVVTGNDDGSLCFWELTDGATLRLVRRQAGYSGSVAQLDIDPSARFVAAGSADNSVRVWNLADGNPAGPVIKHRDHTSVWGVLVRFTPDGERLVTTGSFDSSAHLWDFRSGRELVQPMTHPKSVMSLDISDDGRVLATGCDDGAARVWDLATGRMLGPPLRHGHRPARREPFKVVTVDLSPDGSRLATGSPNGETRVWALPVLKGPLPEWFLKLGEAMAGWRLDEDGAMRLLGHRELEWARARTLVQPTETPLQRWAHWLATDPTARPRSPYVKGR